MWWNDRPYESAAQRRAKMERSRKRLIKSGRNLSPVTAAGRKITTTFWGDSWCKHLESYGDYGNRLPRGRTYLRNGSVIDVQIGPGKVTALVSGSELYEITIDLKPLDKSLWQAIKARCVGQIGSLIDLLQGKLSSEVMSAVTDRAGGVFPQPKEIRMKCSCPDSARLCKHLAAVLYGIGVRFDERPELFFQLRGVDHLELIAAAGAGAAKPKSKSAKALADDALADIFGIEMAGSAVSAEDAEPAAGRSKRKRSRTAALSPRSSTEQTEKQGNGTVARRGRKIRSAATPVETAPPAKTLTVKPRKKARTGKPRSSGGGVNAATRAKASGTASTRKRKSSRATPVGASV